MKDAVLLSFSPDANMRAVGEAANAAGLALMLCGPGESPSRGSLPRDRPLVLLAVGSECGATLAAWVDAHGLEGVAGVGIVGVTAPWAEPFRTIPPIAERLVAALEASRVYGGARVAGSGSDRVLTG